MIHMTCWQRASAPVSLADPLLLGKQWPIHPEFFLGANAVPRELQPAVHMWSPFGAISPKSHVKWSDHLKFQSTNSKQELSNSDRWILGTRLQWTEGILTTVHLCKDSEMLKCLKKSLGLRESVGHFFFSWLVAQSPLATSHCLRCQNLNENLVGQLHGRNGSQDHQPILENLSGFGPIYDM